MSGNLLALLRELSQRDIEYIVVGGMAGVVGDQLNVKVVGLEKLIELKTAAGRPKDQVALPVLRATLAETKRRT